MLLDDGACGHGDLYWDNVLVPNLRSSILLTWINFNCMPSKVRGEITYPFLSSNSCTVEVYGMD